MKAMVINVILLLTQYLRSFVFASMGFSNRTESTFFIGLGRTWPFVEEVKTMASKASGPLAMICLCGLLREAGLIADI